MAKRLLLCALLFSFQAVSAQTTDISLPPEDLDSSGDDDDAFSGSGEGSLPHGSAVAWNVPLQDSVNSSSSPSVAMDLEDQETEAHGTESPSENYDRIPVFPTNIHVFLPNDPVTDKPAVTVEEEVGVFTEQATTSSAVVTERIPITHHTSTLRITTSHDSTVEPVFEPEVHLDVHHDLSGSDRGAPTFDIAPTIHSLDAASSTTTSFVLTKDISSQPENVLPPEDGSGDQGDFTFAVPDEKKELEMEDRAVEELGKGSRAADPGATETKSAETSQGLMDRKDVLAGVIAGGLVGLLFAGFLVGFMLYRMKKKDEGSYSLDEPKQSNGGYQKPHKQEEFYA
ncbi:syndecan-1 [Eublepharis macularius]|uniref:Syndecan n=1 Tax=Eublepharis macularius TaxID=481883 RepID=A0AA97JTM4_EUBMA|nr:syndecan-1 [Eublepharis macularius]